MVDRIVREIEYLAHKLRPYIAFTALNTVWRMIDKGAESILDVGCGRGEPMKFINRHRHFYAVGVDIFEPYFREARKQQAHNELVLSDVRKLPFKKKSFEIVLCTEVLEHLEKSDGKKLIGELEEIASRQIILSAPVGKYKQGAHGGNPYWEHRANWSPAELREMGYRVIGVGIGGMGGEEGLVSHIPKLLWPFVYLVWVLAGPFAYLFPELAGHMVCTKDLAMERPGRS